MKSLGDSFAETYASWLHAISQCFLSFSFRRGEKRRHRESRPSIRVRVGSAVCYQCQLTGPAAEKPARVLRHQPGPVPPPSAERVWSSEKGGRYGGQRRRMMAEERASKRRKLFSVRKRFFTKPTSRRPQISAPTNFRHLYSESFYLSRAQQLPRPPSFLPLQLNLDVHDTHLAPLLPPTGSPEPSLTPPEPAYAGRSAWDDSSVTLTHERSFSSMSFHLPRRPPQDDSPYTTSPDSTPPRVPPSVRVPPPARVRQRAYTSPSVERIVERIANAIIEKEKLQAEIDSVVERQSIYMSSRPSTAHGPQDLEPMPSIPAMPPAAPSFAERLSSESRPQTAPAQPGQAPSNVNYRFQQFSGESNPSPTHPPLVNPLRQVRDDLNRPLAPPLPLVLRPPLRKKKSFSRVSDWLFPSAEQAGGGVSLDSVTNQPRPIRGGEGFYQCVPTPHPTGRASVDTVPDTVSSWGSEDEDQTVPTTWSPGSSPPPQRHEMLGTGSHPRGLTRRATFGRGDSIYGLQNVGVAF